MQLSKHQGAQVNTSPIDPTNSNSMQKHHPQSSELRESPDGNVPDVSAAPTAPHFGDADSDTAAQPQSANPEFTAPQYTPNQYTPNQSQYSTKQQDSTLARNSTNQPYSQYGQYGEANTQAQNFVSGYRTVIPMRPLGIGDTLDGVIRLLKFNPVALILFPLIVAVGFAIINFLVSLFSGQAVLFSSDLLFGLAEDSTSTSTPGLLGFLGALGFTALVSLLLMVVESSIISIAATRTVIASVRGYKLTLRDTWNIVRPRFWSLLLRIIALSLLITLIACALLLIPVVLFALIVNYAPDNNTTGFVAFLIVLFFIAMLFFAVVIYIRLMIAVSALIAEDCGPITAIKRSWHLTRGSFWHIAGLMIFTLIFIFIVFFVISVFTGILLGLFSVATDITAVTTISTVIGLIGALIGALIGQIFIYPVFAALTNLIYVNMRFKRENFHQQLLFEASQGRSNENGNGLTTPNQMQSPLS